jgi:glutathione S-transferase
MWHDIATLEGYLGIQEFYRNSSDFFRDRALPGPEPYTQIPALVDRGRIRIRNFVTKLDKRLRESTYLACPHYTYADIAAFVYLGFARRVLKENPAAEHVNVMRWETAISERAAVQAATG